MFLEDIMIINFINKMAKHKADDDPTPNLYNINYISCHNNIFMIAQYHTMNYSIQYKMVLLLKQTTNISKEKNVFEVFWKF